MYVAYCIILLVNSLISHVADIMRVPAQIILFLNVTILFIFLWVCYKSSPVTEETSLLDNDLALTNVAESDMNLTFGHSHYAYSSLLDHEFPNCEQRTIYNGNAEYSLPDIIKFIHKFIPPPSDFIKHLKNPCWFANYHKEMSDLNLKRNKYDLSKLNDTKTLYCLPYVYLLGYPKCGTTSIFNYFKRHPEFASVSKPYGWIGLRTSGLVNKYPANVESVIDLLNNFYPASRQVEIRSTKDHVNNKIIGDFNSGNSWRQGGFEHLKNGSVCDPPLLLRAIQPNAKFVVMLREPIDRLYSAFWYYPNPPKQLSPEIFIEDIQTFFRRLELCDKRKSMSKCLREAQNFKNHIRDDAIFAKDPQQLRANFYYLYLLPWLQVFPRENFLFIRTEDMKKDTVKTLQKTFQFLGMAPLPKEKLDSIAKINHNSQRNHNYSITLLSSSTKKKLRVHFRPFNEKLAELLNDDRFLWEDID